MSAHKRPGGAMTVMGIRVPPALVTSITDAACASGEAEAVWVRRVLGEECDGVNVLQSDLDDACEQRDSALLSLAVRDAEIRRLRKRLGKTERALADQRKGRDDMKTRKDRLVIDAAVGWWISHRSDSHSTADHLADPAANVNSSAAEALAHAVADYVRADPERGER